MHRTHVAALVAAAVATVPCAASAQVASLENLQVHGYLTQGYAQAQKSGFAGIPTDPTADYRTAALQFRYAITDNDNAVVQLRHRRLGVGAYASAEPEVELNWAFYQHKFGGVAVKAGKMPVPKGIYNEVRSVGTLLPFYRAPIGAYMEGFETIDGAAVANTFDLRKAGSLESQAYGGGFGVRGASTNPQTGQTTTYNVRMTGVYGGEMKWTTPFPGLKLGVGGMRFRSEKATDTSKTPSYSSEWHASVDGTFGIVTVRSEFTNSAYGSATQSGHYFQGGVQVLKSLQLNVQNDFGDMRVTVPGIDRRFRSQRDFAVGANYTLGTNLSVKLEQHSAKYPPNGVGSVLRGIAPTKGNYFIASVSTAF
jgi:hypothetical protein